MVPSSTDATLDSDSTAPKALPIRARSGSKVVFGYNHEVPYNERVFHVQTEDSGHPRDSITSHIFASGNIIAFRQYHYHQDSSVSEIERILRSTHKQMLRDLIHGYFDDDIASRLAIEVRPTTTRRRPDPHEARIGARTPAHHSTPSSVGHIDDFNLENGTSLDMDNVATVLSAISSSITGTLGVALVDYESGLCLGSRGNGINIDVAAAGNAEVMKAKSRVMRELGLKGGIEDILITLDTQYHIIRPVGTKLFLYLAIDKAQGNLAMARHKLASSAQQLEL